MRSKRLKILAFLLGGVTIAAVGYFLYGELRLQSQTQDLNRFCSSLTLQMPLAQVETTVAFSPRLRMILLSQSEDGEQLGSIYYEGAERWGCAVTFSRGRLARKAFESGNFAREPGQPKRKLKSW